MKFECLLSEYCGNMYTLLCYAIELDNDYFNSNYDSCCEELDKLVDNLGSIHVLIFSCYPSFEFRLRICLFDE